MFTIFTTIFYILQAFLHKHNIPSKICLSLTSTFLFTLSFAQIEGAYVPCDSLGWRASAEGVHLINKLDINCHAPLCVKESPLSLHCLHEQPRRCLAESVFKERLDLVNDYVKERALEYFATKVLKEYEHMERK